MKTRLISGSCYVALLVGFFCLKVFVHDFFFDGVNEPCILVLEIMSYVKNEKGDEVPGKILIQVLDSKDPTKIVKQGQKDGLHDAFSMGLIWLEHELKRAQA